MKADKPVSTLERIVIRVSLLFLTAATLHFEMMLTRLYEQYINCNVN